MKGGLSQGIYYPEEELGNPSVLNRSTGAQGINTASDPCEGNWGNYGCQELATVVVTAKRTSDGPGGDIIFISLPIDVFYDFPDGGDYEGWTWFPMADPTTIDYDLYDDLTFAWGEPCPNSFRFKNVAPTAREALVWGLHFSYEDFNDIKYETTFGLNIHIPSDIDFNAGQTYAALRGHFSYERVSSGDLRLVTDANGIQHLLISQVAQTQLAVDAVFYANWKAIEVNDIAIIKESKTGFHRNYALDVAFWLADKVPGASAYELNTKPDGTTPYKQKGNGRTCD